MVKPTERRVGYGVALGYGITDLFGGGAFAIIGTWLLFFTPPIAGSLSSKRVRYLLLPASLMRY